MANSLKTSDDRKAASQRLQSAIRSDIETPEVIEVYSKWAEDYDKVRKTLRDMISVEK